MMGNGENTVTIPPTPRLDAQGIANYADSTRTARTLTEREQRALLAVTGEHRAEVSDDALEWSAVGSLASQDVTTPFGNLVQTHTIRADFTGLSADEQQALEILLVVDLQTA